MNNNIQHIVILGGGTAGWLAANHVGKALRGNPNYRLTVIESPDIPTIGVGEGTVPMMRQTLKSFGISEDEFIARCDVSFKQSIQFVNWLDKTKHGANNSYHHLFDFPFPFEQDLTPYWLQNCSTRSFADTVSVQAGLCNAQLAPKTLQHRPYEGDSTYAYHLDARKFAMLLSEHAQKHFGVKHQQHNIIDAQLSEQGNITALVTADGQLLPFDFYIDCSGFSSLLLGKVLQVPFIDKSAELMIDKALTVQVPTDSAQPLPSSTLATAHQAGWIWDIALPHRRGVGFVYASKFMDAANARRKLEHYLGVDISELNVREIPMTVGFRQQFWKGNCVALGLAQGFVEPLEATSILLTDYSARLLAAAIPGNSAELAHLALQFNQRLEYSWLRVIDFIKLHYYVSDRNDSAFWRAMREPDSASEQLKILLAKWRYKVPQSSDFFSKFDVFDVENYLYVLYGMRYETKTPWLEQHYQDWAEQKVAQVADVRQRLSKQLPSHRQLVQQIKQRFYNNY